MPLTAGAGVGPYEIISLVGSGGMGEVYRARDPRLQREVAIKLLPAKFSGDPERLRRFEREARAAAALNHPNVLTVFDIGTESGSPYIVSELLEGQTLRARLLKAPARSGVIDDASKSDALGEGRGVALATRGDARLENFITRLSSEVDLRSSSRGACQLVIRRI